MGLEDSSEGESGNGANWKEWTEWSTCSHSCGEGSLKLRTRVCSSDERSDCLGESVQVESCYLQPC